LHLVRLFVTRYLSNGSSDFNEIWQRCLTQTGRHFQFVTPCIHTSKLLEKSRSEISTIYERPDISDLKLGPN
jgi:hypothetical protein